MRNIGSMTYSELFTFKIELKETLDKSFFINDLFVYNNHLCKRVLMNDYKTYGDETPYAYIDIFTNNYVGMASIIASIPAFSLILNSYGITHSKERIEIDELLNLWNAYQNSYTTKKR